MMSFNIFSQINTVSKDTTKVVISSEVARKIAKDLIRLDGCIEENQQLYSKISLLENREGEKDKKIEMPVAENLQLGISTGLALEGFVPVSVYPRWNFLLLASDQLVNHLDKLPIMTDGAYKPKVIIRVAVGVRHPVDPQEQHVGDFTEAFRSMLKSVNMVKLNKAEEIIPAYKYAFEREDGVSTILVEEHQF